MRYAHKQDILWGAVFIGIIALIIYYWVHIWNINNTIKVIDGCQYIQTWNGRGWNLTHKGNCTNAIHYRK
jgi:hypothetical protein